MPACGVAVALYALTLVCKQPICWNPSPRFLPPLVPTEERETPKHGSNFICQSVLASDRWAWALYLHFEVQEAAFWISSPGGHEVELRAASCLWELSWLDYEIVVDTDKSILRRQTETGHRNASWLRDVLVFWGIFVYVCMYVYVYFVKIYIYALVYTFKQHVVVIDLFSILFQVHDLW